MANILFADIFMQQAEFHFRVVDIKKMCNMGNLLFH